MEPRQQFRNTQRHTIGVNIFEPGTGKPTSVALFPGETIWLSEDEQRMTAQAPRSHEDNHFVSGALEPVTDERPIGRNARPIAGIVGGAVQGPNSPTLQQGGEEDAEPIPEGIFEDTPEDQEARRRAEAARRQGQVGAVPEQNVDVVVPETAALAGDDIGPDELEGEPESGEGQLEGEGVEEVAAEEETAVDSREETGAAVEPAGDPPEGEYAEHEEVGDPEAPAAEGDEETASAGTPFRQGKANGRQGKKNRRR